MNVGWLVVAMGAAALLIAGYLALLVAERKRLAARLEALRASDRRETNSNRVQDATP